MAGNVDSRAMPDTILAMCHSEAFNGTHCVRCLAPIALLLLVTLVPADLWAVGPTTHVLRWNIHETNSLTEFTNAIKIAAGVASGDTARDVAIRIDGTVQELGGDVPPPAGLSNVVAVAAGDAGTVAVTANGSVVAWGGIFAGGLTNVPAGLTNAVDVAVSAYSTAVLRADGTVVAWGANDSGHTNVPPGLSNVVALAVGAWYSLALKADGTVVGWGHYAGGLEVVIPPGLSNVVSITGGFGHFLALHANGSLTIWGFKNEGQTNLPAGLTNALAIAAPVSSGGEHSMALRSDGVLVAWGSYYSQATNVPAGLTNVVAISAGGNGDGYDYNLALVADGPFFTAPRLRAVVNNNVATVALQGEARRRYVLESTSLLNDSAGWTFERNVRLTSTNQVVHQSPVNQTRFFRARQVY